MVSLKPVSLINFEDLRLLAKRGEYVAEYYKIKSLYASTLGFDSYIIYENSYRVGCYLCIPRKYKGLDFLWLCDLFVDSRKVGLSFDFFEAYLSYNKPLVAVFGTKSAELIGERFGFNYMSKFYSVRIPSISLMSSFVWFENRSMLFNVALNFYSKLIVGIDFIRSRSLPRIKYLYDLEACERYRKFAGSYCEDSFTKDKVYLDLFFSIPKSNKFERWIFVCSEIENHFCFGYIQQDASNRRMFKVLDSNIISEGNFNSIVKLCGKVSISLGLDYFKILSPLPYRNQLFSTMVTLRGTADVSGIIVKGIDLESWWRDFYFNITK
jgi:hypothetical protein